MSVQGTTLGRSAPWRLTIIRLVAHIMSPGRLSRIAQHRVVISGTDSSRAETVTVGYGGSTFRRSGAFTVRVTFRKARATNDDIKDALRGALFGGQRVRSKEGGRSRLLSINPL